MADHTGIEWTDATWNPITGCSVVSPGCTNCYAMRLAGTRLAHHPSRAGLTRDSKAGPVWTGEVRFNPQWLDQPLRWSKPRQIFVCAHGDLFHESVPDAWIDQVFAVMAAAHWHTFQVLTKRADRMAAYLDNRTGAGEAAERWVAASWQMVKTMPALKRAGWSWAAEDMPWPLPNVWAGVSVEDQKRADERIPHLLQTYAAVRWVSAEPLLGSVDIRPWLDRDFLTGCADDDAAPLATLDWVVAGGESGPGARPMHPAWARSLRDQCAAAGVAFHFKQHGDWIGDCQHDAAEDRVSGKWQGSGHDGAGGLHYWPTGETDWSIRIGKKAAGRLLDGVEHSGMPGQ